MQDFIGDFVQWEFECFQQIVSDGVDRLELRISERSRWRGNNDLVGRVRQRGYRLHIKSGDTVRILPNQQTHRVSFDQKLLQIEVEAINAQIAVITHLLALVCMLDRKEISISYHKFAQTLNMHAVFLMHLRTELSNFVLLPTDLTTNHNGISANET